MVEHHIKEAQCWDILTDISVGLKFFYDEQLIRLDIKPANIMISTDCVCKLGDSGLLIDLTELNPETMKQKRAGVSVSEGDSKYVSLEVLRLDTYLQTSWRHFQFGFDVEEGKTLIDASYIFTSQK